MTRASVPSLWCWNTLTLFDDHRLGVCSSLWSWNMLTLFDDHRLGEVVR